MLIGVVDGRRVTVETLAAENGFDKRSYSSFSLISNSLDAECRDCFYNDCSFTGCRNSLNSVDSIDVLIRI